MNKEGMSISLSVWNVDSVTRTDLQMEQMKF
ncbi:MAG: hypothetical protein BWY66_02109 [bacterium ADurb.Bin374]|nr:MAG: hypothetical protein BWY66_02109 [bacterium ADurb.Bin374]